MWIIEKMCLVSMLRNPRYTLLSQTLRTFQNHSCDLVRVVLAQQRSNDEDTQNVSSCHFLKQTSQTGTGVDLARQALVQHPRTSCRNPRLDMNVPFQSHQKTAGPRTSPSSEQGAEIDLGAIPDGVHEVVACSSEKCNEVRSTDQQWLVVSRFS